MKLLLCFLVLLIGSSESARILGIFPTPSISHQVVFHALVKDLAERGHHLTILTPNLMKTDNSNITQIDLNGAYASAWKDLNQVELKLKPRTTRELHTFILKTHMAAFEWQLEHPEVKKLIQNAEPQAFDVILVELMFHRAALAFGEIFDCPMIEITSMEPLNDNYGMHGNAMNPVIHPENVLPYHHGRLTFMQRAKSLMMYFLARLNLEPMVNDISLEIIRKHFPTVKTPIKDLMQNIHLLMSNTNPALGSIRPLVPTTIQLGFMHIEKPKPLPEGAVKAFLDNSKNGVIYMSLGSNAKSKDLSDDLVRLFLNVFSKVNADVLWKFEAENLPGKPDNVMISKWLPQADMLAHPKVKLFITHGGQQSMEEAIDREVPLVVIPFVVDQHTNAMRMKEKGIALDVDINGLTESELMETINEMLKPQYKKNVVKLRKQVYDQPMTSRERAVWWTEFVIRNKGTKHIEYHGRHTPTYQKYWIDMIAIALVLAFILTKIFMILIRIFLAKVMVFSTKKTDLKIE